MFHVKVIYHKYWPLELVFLGHLYFELIKQLMTKFEWFQYDAQSLRQREIRYQIFIFFCF